MRSKEDIEKKLKELISAKTEFEKFYDFGIRNLDEYNMAVKILKWVLGE
ncbi:MAG: hypothetical protein RMJ18_01355 [Candidatus Aenigmarchaeota archaeon]|nr:hypothetical protein [Candidatus Aenigmarchaeota archaeon]MDW8160048.1 hypothetical protein [Candidatus Aenigmarchaeota archaeon]